MKRLLVLIAFLFSAGISFGQTAPTFAQPNYSPTTSNSNITVGQMLNVANPYTGTVEQDTMNASGAINLTIAIGGGLATTLGGIQVKATPLVAADTFLPYPIFGYGSISFGLTITKVSGTPDVTAKLQESYDGISWYDIHYSNASIASSTLTSTSVTTTYTNTTPGSFTAANIAGAQTFSIDLPIKYACYYQWALSTSSVTQVSTVKAKYCFNKNAVKNN